MARGWESKSVDEQQSSHDVPRGSVAAKAKLKDGEVDAQRERRRRDLELQRERILSERTASPVRRAALQAALQEIETRLQSLAD